MNDENKKRIPELRFPEFVKKEAWAEKAINDIAISQSSSVALNKLILKESGFPVYGADSIVGYIDKFQQKDIYVSIVKDGSGVGRLNLCLKESSVLGTLAYIKSKDAKEYNIIWIYYLLNTIDFTKYIKGAGIPHIYFSDFKEERIAVPTPNEQQKIASCLSSLDELIGAQKEKLDLLKNHKKGLMQNLFPQEGETVPKFRFPEFENDGDWIENSLESLTTRIGDGIHTTPKYFIDGEYAFINGNNLINGKIVIEESTKRVSKEEYLKHNRNLSDATILLSINGTIGNIAKYIDEKVILGKSACYINIESNKVYKNFIFYYIQTGTIKSYFNSELTGSTIKNLSLKSIKEAKLKIPNGLLEQKKIATCLSSLDDLISTQTEKIEKLQLHKKGLMQGLFPKIID